MAKIKLLVLFITILLPSLAQAENREYLNDRFGFKITYPDELKAQGESSNGDGQKFLSADQATLLVYGQFNDGEEEFNEVYNDELREDLQITYKTFKKNDFVISGIQGDNVVYRKVIVQNVRAADKSDSQQIIAHLELVYPKSEANKYEPIAKQLAASFKFYSKGDY